jgi:hypothetical protein
LTEFKICKNEKTKLWKSFVKLTAQKWSEFNNFIEEMGGGVRIMNPPLKLKPSTSLILLAAVLTFTWMYEIFITFVPKI